MVFVIHKNYFCLALNLGLEIHEVPINYNGRNYEEGKKIKTIDAFRALKTLIKYR